MGDFTTVGLDVVAAKFLEREEETTQAVNKMLEVGAEVLVKAQQDEAAAMGIKETAGFIQSIKATKVKGDEVERYVEVYPQGKAKHGNDRKGDKGNVRYATIGFIAQYGTSSQPARPYMTAANEKARESVSDAMYEVWKGVTNG